MIKIGIVNIDTSHPLGFVKSMAGSGRCVFSGLYNDGFRGEDEVSAFCSAYGIQRFGTLEQLAGEVDVGFIQGCNWDKHLAYAQPFFALNKPVFLDKPMVGNLADLARLRALSAEGKVILGSSSVRYCEEITGFLQRAQGKVETVFATVGVDTFNYAVHIAEGVCTLLKDKPIWVERMSDSAAGELFLVQFAGGGRAVLLLVSGRYLNFNFTVVTDREDTTFQVDADKLYRALIERICDQLEGQQGAVASVDELCVPIELMLACEAARKTGKRVQLADLPKLDVRFDGDAFEAQYRAQAAKIYL